MIAAALLSYATLLLACGSPALARASWPDRAPRLAIAARRHTARNRSARLRSGVG